MPKISHFTVLVFGLLISIGASAKSPSEQTVYVTIDDAPLAGIFNILSVIEEQQVPITLFAVGQHVVASKQHEDALTRAKKNPNILVGNHSYSHAHEHYQHFYSSASGVVDDMKKNNRLIGLTTAPFHSRLPGRDVFRLPGLSTEDPYITRREDKKERIDYDELAHQGFFLYGWDLEWAHATSGKPIQSVAKVMEEIKTRFSDKKTTIDDHLILLMHDQMFSDHLNGHENFSAMITALKASGYNLATLDKYPLQQE